MSESHVAREALEAYVIGALDEAEAARLESHVLACPACEARLQHEASLELAFTQVARAPEARPRRAGRVAAPIAAVGGVLAVAAAMILWLGAHGDVDARAPAAEAPTTISDTAADASTATAQLDVPGDGAVRSAMRD